MQSKVGQNECRGDVKMNAEESRSRRMQRKVGHDEY